MKKLGDRIALLLTGLAAATAAWGFWYTTGSYGFQILSAAAIVILVFENRRLRKRLQQARTERKN